MTIKCEFCGAEYEKPPGKFCDRCGRILSRIDPNAEPPAEEETEYVKCLKCGHRNQLDATVCLNCGERLYERKVF